MQWKRALMRRGQWIAVAGIAMSIFAQGCALQSEEFEGTWVITEVLQPDATTIHKQNVDDQLGLSMTYLDDQAQLGQRHCSSPHYDTSYLRPEEIGKYYHPGAESLFIGGNSVQYVRVTCEEEGTLLGATLLLQSKGTAYTVSDGVFFKLEKAATHTG